MYLLLLRFASSRARLKGSEGRDIAKELSDKNRVYPISTSYSILYIYMYIDAKKKMSGKS